jgi:hypothetical protein
MLSIKNSSVGGHCFAALAANCVIQSATKQLSDSFGRVMPMRLEMGLSVWQRRGGRANGGEHTNVTVTQISQQGDTG